MYDENNIFAKIVKKQIPCELIAENSNAIAFSDLYPAKKIHILIIPKGQYINFTDFITKATEKEKVDLFNLIEEAAKKMNIQDGYRLITNNGKNARQEIPHLHFHLLSGEDVGPMVQK